MKSILFYLVIFLNISLLFAQEKTEQLAWPREIEAKNSVVTIYQPQVESFKSDTLSGRMAISIKPKEGNVVFCAAWFKAKMSTDKEERTVTLESVEIPRIHFPDYDNKEKIEKFTQLLVKEIESWNVVMSLDRLIASLEEIDDIKQISVKLNNNPPDIYFRTVPTTLITIDGDLL